MASANAEDGVNETNFSEEKVNASGVSSGNQEIKFKVTTYSSKSLNNSSSTHVCCWHLKTCLMMVGGVNVNKQIQSSNH